MDTPEWPFSDPEETEVVTLDRIVRGESPVLLAAHDDDGWQFMDGEQIFEDDGEVVQLGEITQLDPSLLELADLPIGWYARRASPQEPWSRAEGEPDA